MPDRAGGSAHRGGFEAVFDPRCVVRATVLMRVTYCSRPGNWIAAMAMADRLLQPCHALDPNDLRRGPPYWQARCLSL